MATRLDNTEENRPLNQDNAETNEEKGSKVTCALDNITVNVFFDGTGNNMFNTEHRLEDEKLINEEYQRRQIPADITEEEKNKIREQIRQEVARYNNLNGQISYDNDLSNVALLYNAAEVDTGTLRVYIEGAGTIKDETDDQGGLAAATGVSGIMDRIFEAFVQTRQQIKDLKSSMITFNVFGFSRGAFYGRYFAVLLKQKFTEKDVEAAKKEAVKKAIAAQKRAQQNEEALKKRIEQQKNPPSGFSSFITSTAKTVGSIVFYPITAIKKIANNKLPVFESLPILTNDYDRQNSGRALLDYQPEEIIINLLGIYDTVTSHGWDHHNDSVDFKLDVGAKQDIKKVIHITAENEYRNHFALVTTNTAVSDRNNDDKPTGFQCSIPGAHADIGGGYIKIWEEKSYYLSNYDRPETTGFFNTDAGEVNWRWFRDKGYYGYGKVTTTYSEIAKTRKAINEMEQEVVDKQAKVDENKEQNIENLSDQKALELAQEKLAAAKKQLDYQYQDVLASDQTSNSNVNTTTDEDSVLLRRDGYKAGDFEVNHKWALNLQAYYEVRATRQFTENAYQYVGLKMMHQMAKDAYIDALKFINMGVKELNTAYAEVDSDPVLSKFCNYAVDTSVKNYPTYSKQMLKIKMEDVLQEKEFQYVYHNFVHNSLQSEFTLSGIANYLTNGSRDYNKDTNFKPVRVIVHDDVNGVQNTVEGNPYTNVSTPTVEQAT